MTEHLSNGQFAKKEVTVNSTEKAHLWKPGQSGNPKGRKKGVPNRTTRAVKEFLAALVDDTETQEAVRERIRKGDAVAFFRALEHVVGKPKEYIEHSVGRELVETLKGARDRLANGSGA